ncbi:hypothetical protein V5R04_07150 [Jonesiaceae bacterium BS-20]|uniref:Uncharacterized protein n=1 Tax=Jonesiaceae bacterium BS-20 TaxID=3120821 RepID=A0AAU7E0D0_9MICO
MNSSRSTGVANGLIFIGVIALLGALYWLFPAQIGGLGRAFWYSVPLKVIVIGFIISLALLVRGEGPFIVGLILTGLVAVGTGVGSHYHRASQPYTSVDHVQGTQDTYRWRQPWVTAAAVAPSKAGAITGDFITEHTKYLPGVDAYSTPVVARGIFSGYSELVVQEHGKSVATVCKFKEQTPRPGGPFHQSLSRAVARVSPMLKFEDRDTWAYCHKDGYAELVVPVTKYKGFPEGHQVPAGIVVLDGVTVTHIANVEPGEYPGPVYPASIAAMQRASTVTATGWWDMRLKRAGYETTSGGTSTPSSSSGSDEATDQPDIANPSEILLALENNQGWDYVTPLVPRGASSSIVAVSSVAADQVTSGQFNDLEIRTLESPRLGNQALTLEIESQFPQLNWRANGLGVVEVLPLSQGQWSATVANRTTPMRQVNVDLDGTVCLTDIGGGNSTCDTPTNTDNDDNNDNHELDPPPAMDDEPQVQVPQSTELDGLTSEELIELQRHVNEEVARRFETAVNTTSKEDHR